MKTRLLAFLAGSGGRPALAEVDAPLELPGSVRGVPRLGAPPARPRAHPLAAPAPPPFTRGGLDKVAEAAVHIASLGPRLAKVAADLEDQARAQARSAADMASTTEALVDELNRAVRELGETSGRVAQALDTVRRIADHTKLLSINASIEAARAGQAGRSFTVVVDEVKGLAESSGSATAAIQSNIGLMEASVARVAVVATGSVGAAADSDQAHNLGEVTRQVRAMAQSAGSQLSCAQDLSGMGDQVKSLSERLLLAIGHFRFEAHAQASAALACVLPEMADLARDRRETEAALDRFLARHPWFEVAYVTDTAGRQCVDNVVRTDQGIGRDPAGHGRNWADRPWFVAAQSHPGVSSTDIYRSKATGDYCFTVAAQLRSPDGRNLGVVGADVNFTRLVLRGG